MPDIVAMIHKSFTKGEFNSRFRNIDRLQNTSSSLNYLYLKLFTTKIG